ncbi:hypothetical protein EXIGLDRAFT_773679 [Exidia glandulosa HHB12029]|uniref:F-box domain-containing protein n=1 Tax=Exidia glandulosa HHB12029 TaxID=1314781 RepID=A0A165EPJ8_EXIGL|nr:hypothetical protein EXIGLDRAFT_773679 [Exidia glandulosa HHB12029]
MSTSAQETRRQHIRAEGDEIAELQARMGQLFRCASMEPARVATDDIELEMPGVTSHRQYHASQARIEPLLPAYRRDFMATVQPDIMHCIFAELARDDSRDTKVLFDISELVVHHRSRPLATTPFAVAGVCRHWREIALDSAVLWSNIHVTETHGAQLAVLRLLLQRSRNAPLDVAFQPISLDAGYRGEIIRTLITSTSRWRTAQLQTLTYEALSATLSLLELPTPLLERVEIYNSRGIYSPFSVLDSPSNRRLLPYAPRLRTVDVNSGPAISTLPRASYPSLRCLKWSAPGLDHLWNLLKSANLTLEILDLRSPIVPVTSLSPTAPPNLSALALPNLLNLLIETPMPGIAQFCLLMSMPRLSAISISLPLHPTMSAGLEPHFGRFFETVASTVTHLRLSGNILVSYLMALRLLHNVEDVHFDRPGRVGESFFAALTVGHDGTEPMDAVWPKLRSIRLSTVIDNDTRGLLPFLAMRRAPHLDSESVFLSTQAADPRPQHRLSVNSIAS